jgi:uncharacterized membrane protein YidH (DUF202 family)
VHCPLARQRRQEIKFKSDCLVSGEDKTWINEDITEQKTEGNISVHQVTMAILGRCLAAQGTRKYIQEWTKFSRSRGAMHQLLSIILILRIVILLPLTILPYAVIVDNYSKIRE